jgi:hypothetical protein
MVGPRHAIAKTTPDGETNSLTVVPEGVCSSWMVNVVAGSMRVLAIIEARSDSVDWTFSPSVAFAMPGRARQSNTARDRSAALATCLIEFVMAVLRGSLDRFDIRRGDLVSCPAPQKLTGEPPSSDGVTATFEARTQRATVGVRAGIRVAMHFEIRVVT